jgi:hypothetical protein
MLNRKYFRNWTKQVSEVLFFSEEDRRSKESRRGLGASLTMRGRDPAPGRAPLW